MNLSSWGNYISEPARIIPWFWYPLPYLVFIIFFNNFNKEQGVFESAKKASYICLIFSGTLLAMGVIPVHIPTSFATVILVTILAKIRG